MTTSDRISTDDWIVKNYDVILSYARANDVSIYDMDLPAKAFNALRMSDCWLLSQFVLKTRAEIAEICFDDRNAAEEICIFVREWLYSNRDKISALSNKNRIYDNEHQAAEPDDAPRQEIEPSDAPQLTTDTNTASRQAIQSEDAFRQKIDDDYVKRQLAELAKQHDMPIETLDLSVRAYNALKRYHVNMFSDLVALYPDEYAAFRNMGKKTVEEINNLLECCLSDFDNLLRNDIDLPIADTELKDIYLEHDMPIERLNLSVRAYNALKSNHINMFSELIAMYPDGYANFRNMGRRSTEEINKRIKQYIAATAVTPQTPPTDSDEDTQPVALDIAALSAIELFYHPKTKSKAWEYLYQNDIDISSMNFTPRCANCLLKLGVNSFSSLVEKIDQITTSSARSMGIKSVNEIKSIAFSRLEKIKPFVAAYCSGNIQTLYSDEYIKKTVLDLFANIGFSGLSFKEIKEKFPEAVDEAKIKKAIGALIHDNVLEYVDFRCYRVYPSFFDVLKKEYELSGSRDSEYLFRRYNGETLEQIAKGKDLTRERVRQICAKKERAIRNKYVAETGLNSFDEDYYAYFYSVYEVPKEFISDFLKLPASVFSYLKNAYPGGKESLGNAYNDPKLDLNLKIRIRDYLNRNKIEIDGELIDKNRRDIEDFVLERCCQDELTYDEFVLLYNNLLKKNNITDERLLLTDDGVRSRSNRLTESRKCLWKQGERLRYYDIDAHDYGELLETIGLDDYSDIDISTLKFMEDYPEIMEKYDIRDEYELHNLLKKVLGNNAPSGITFLRQPIISFGQSNRTELYRNILRAVSPVTADEFAEYIHMENGFNKQTVLSSREIQQLSEYYHNGIYSMNYKRLPEEHAQKLEAILKDDFYYIDEILKIYKTNFDDADSECISPRTIKSMGFNVFSVYAIKNYQTAESYFRQLLTKDDVFDISPYRSRYGTIVMFVQLVMELKREREILMFENNLYINFRKLAKVGVTKQMIEDFCSKADVFVPPDTYFTIQSLRAEGFSHELEDLGFSDTFYAGILAVSPLFCYQRVYGSTVLYSGNDNKRFSTKAFIQSLLREYEDIDVDDFIDDVYEKYGIRIPGKYDVTAAVVGTEMYYDSIMNKIYSDKALYYSDLDD